MSRPSFTLSTVKGGLDGDYVDVQFGKPGSEGHFRTTLRDDWSKQPRKDQEAEARRRYDEWLVAINPPVLEPSSVLADLRAQRDGLLDQIRDLTRQRLDVEDRIKEAEAAALPLYGTADGWFVEDAEGRVTPGIPTVGVSVVLTLSDGLTVVGTVQEPPTEGP